MNIELLEKAFLNYVADCCDLVVDKTVFRSEIPTAQGEGTAVIINGIDKQNAYDMTAYKFQVLCRGKKRSGDYWHKSYAYNREVFIICFSRRDHMRCNQDGSCL